MSDSSHGRTTVPSSTSGTVTSPNRHTCTIPAAAQPPRENTDNSAHVSLLERLRGKPSHWIHLAVALLWWRLLRGAATKRYRLQSMFTLMTTVLPSELSLGCVGILHFTIVWTVYRSLKQLYRRTRRPSESEEISCIPGWNQLYPAITVAAGVNALSTGSWVKMAYSVGASNREIIRQLEVSNVPTANVRKTSFTNSVLSSCLPVASFRLPSDVDCNRDIPYWKPRQSSAPLKLDIYSSRRKRLRNAPVFMYIHGGGWVFGDKRYASRDLLHRLAQEGWIVVSIQYRLTPKVSWPFHLLDCKRALLWIKKYISTYGGDPGKTAVGGDSAGGHLAAMVALTANDPTFQSGYLDVDTSVCACIDLYGIMDLTDSHFLYRAKDTSHGMKKLSQNVLRRKFPKERPEFVKASPFWWVQGSVAMAKELHASTEEEDIESLNRCARVGAIETEKYKEVLTQLRQRKEKKLDEPSSFIGLVPPTGSENKAETGSARKRYSKEQDEKTYENKPDAVDYEPARIPPFLIVHGMFDTLVPVEDSILFWNALQRRRKRDKDAWNAYRSDELHLAERILLRDPPVLGLDCLAPEKRDTSNSAAKPLEVWGYLDLEQKRNGSLPIRCRSFEPNSVEDALILLGATHHAFNYSPSFRTHSVSSAVVDYLDHVISSGARNEETKL
eukprot:gb/GECG01011419.1/.p1 GENE.gb/GECG01011419.1/~~gb/GECG01011419.1/.p1  ORF type:complete len:670 (+),score=76.37 gb/GECG01011419.1/:1-2010(+)